MGELTLKERLQPSLLDRLTDHRPEERQEARRDRAIDESELRELLRRDLTWLLNSTNLAAVRELREHPEVARSVVNYGIGGMSGRTLTGVDPQQVERMIREAIWNFEPRLLRRSVHVRVSTATTGRGERDRPTVDKDAKNPNSLVIDIEADLWADPLPISLHLRTEFDLESGAVRVDELTASR